MYFFFIFSSQNNSLIHMPAHNILSLVTRPENICREPMGLAFVCIKQDVKR